MTPRYDLMTQKDLDVYLNALERAKLNYYHNSLEKERINKLQETAIIGFHNQIYEQTRIH